MNKTMNIASLIMVIILLIYTVINYSSLPSKVPIHYDLYGQTDQWSNKGGIFVLPIIAIMLWFFLYILYKFYNKIAELGLNTNNKKPSHQSIKLNEKFIIILNLELSMFFSIMGIIDIYNIKGGNIDLGIFQFLLLAVILSITILWLIYQEFKIRKNGL